MEEEMKLPFKKMKITTEFTNSGIVRSNFKVFQNEKKFDFFQIRPLNLI